MIEILALGLYSLIHSVLSKPEQKQSLDVKNVFLKNISNKKYCMVVGPFFKLRRSIVMVHKRFCVRMHQFRALFPSVADSFLGPQWK